jgi:hypothetical protein
MRTHPTMRTLAALGCLLLVAWNGGAARAESNHLATEQPHRGRPYIGHGPTALSVFKLARRLVEAGELESSRAPGEIKNEALRLPLRNQLALSIRHAGLETAFGDYVATAVSAWEFWDPRTKLPTQPLLHQNQVIEAAAKIVFLGGNAEEARHLLAFRLCFSTLYLVTRCTPPDELMLGWELDAGKLAAAVDRLRETDWGGGSEISLTARVAQWLVAAGRADEAYEMLERLRSKKGLNQAWIALAYWRLGAVERAHSVMREIASVALDDATRNPLKNPPVDIAGMQMALGDREGAIETLTQIRKFAAKRLEPLRGPLAGRLAFVGLDADAAALLTGTPADRDILGNIVVGQARRGDFAAAFATLRKLDAVPLLDADGKTFSAALGSTTVIVSIVRNAARAGDTAAFEQAETMRRKQADVMRRAFNSGTVFSVEGHILRGSDEESIGDLARAGKVRFAISFALALPNLAKRLEGLESIAEALRGLPNPLYYPLAFYDPM